MSIDLLSAVKGYGGMAQAASKPNPVMDGAKRFAEIFDRADDSAQGFAAGTVDAQSVVEALSQAEMALQTAVTMRDWIVGAYQDILRMPI